MTQPFTANNWTIHTKHEAFLKPTTEFLNNNSQRSTQEIFLNICPNGINKNIAIAILQEACR